MAPSRLFISSSRGTGASAICVGQDERSSPAAFSDVCLSFSNALCCRPVGLTISSMRCTGNLVKLVAWSLQSEARLVTPEEPLAAVPRACPVSSAPIALPTFASARNDAQGQQRKSRLSTGGRICRVASTPPLISLAVPRMRPYAAAALLLHHSPGHDLVVFRSAVMLLSAD
jgi:hypothetical protein